MSDLLQTAHPRPEVLAAFEGATGFMPVDEGLALYAAAVAAARRTGRPCWRSAPTAAARRSCWPRPPGRPAPWR